MPKLLFKKGQSGNPKGRGKGHLNKFTTLKQSFMDAYSAIGGTGALINWLTTDAKLKYYDKKKKKVTVLDISGDRKKEFFKMMASMLPKDVTLSGNPDAPLQVQFNNIKGMIENACDTGESKREKPAVLGDVEKQA